MSSTECSLPMPPTVPCRGFERITSIAIFCDNLYQLHQQSSVWALFLIKNESEFGSTQWRLSYGDRPTVGLTQLINNG